MRVADPHCAATDAAAAAALQSLSRPRASSGLGSTPRSSTPSLPRWQQRRSALIARFRLPTTWCGLTSGSGGDAATIQGCCGAAAACRCRRGGVYTSPHPRRWLAQRWPLRLPAGECQLGAERRSRGALHPWHAAACGLGRRQRFRRTRLATRYAPAGSELEARPKTRHAGTTMCAAAAAAAAPGWGRPCVREPRGLAARAAPVHRGRADCVEVRGGADRAVVPSRIGIARTAPRRERRPAPPARAARRACTAAADDRAAARARCSAARLATRPRLLPWP